VTHPGRGVRRTYGTFEHLRSCRPSTRVHSCASIEACDRRPGF
jgi:hypothetical protein